MFNFTDYKTPICEGIRLPKFKPSSEDYAKLGVSSDISNYDFFRKLCFRGIKDLGIDKLPNYQSYIDRAKHELKTLNDLCLVDYMLIVWDYLNFCKKSNIPIGPGRGSAAGSLVAYLIGITNKVDPIKYNLYFERFLSVDRVQPKQIDGQTFLKDCADIDSDISYRRRHEVVAYINAKYPGQTAQIATLNTLSGKLCIKEVCKLVGEYSEEESQKISDMVEKTFGIVDALKDVYNDNPDFKEWADKNPRLYSIARKLENLNKNYGVHASGIAIAPENREKTFPCQKTKDGNIVTSWEMDVIGGMAVKIDCLGLRTLDVLDEASKASGISLDSIDPEDPSIYKQFQNLDHKYGLFQIETDAGYRIVKQIKPNHFSQLSDIVAINRPGAIQFLDDYIAYKEGTKEIPKIHPIIDEILKDTGGVLLMQEQTMRILHEVYKFTLVEANQLRKVIGKKLRNEVGAWEEKIRKRGEELQINPSTTNWYWSSIKASADYQFNASHSKSYSFLTMYTAWYKANKPKEFFLGCLKMALSEPKPQDIISEISQEMNRFGIRLLPPDLAQSDMDFAIVNNDIRYGLIAIKGVSEKTEKSIILLTQLRESSNPTKYDIFLAAKQAGINIGVFSALIQAGTLDSFDTQRSRLVLEAQVFNKLKDAEKIAAINLGPKYNFDIIETLKGCVKDGAVGTNGKLLFSEKRMSTIRKDCAKYFEIFALNSKNEKMANWYFEKTLLGYAHSVKLKECFSTPMLGYSDLKKLKKFQKGVFVGQVVESIKSVSAKGNAYIRISLADEEGTFGCMLIDNKKYKKCTEFLESGAAIPEEGEVVVVYGSPSEDVVFVDSMKIATNTIYMKMRDLSDEDVTKESNELIEKSFNQPEKPATELGLVY